MISKNKYRILIWVIIILLATNLSTVFSFIYHRISEEKMVEQSEEQEFIVPEQQRARFFREQMGLQPNQVIVFRELNRDFNRTAWQINNQLSLLRINMIQELGSKNPDKEKLANIAENIGKLHTELKNVTIQYYLSMKENCTEEQEEKLYAIFMSILKNDENIKLPHRGRRHRDNW
jgi:hypothetical protein